MKSRRIIFLSALALTGASAVACSLSDGGVAQLDQGGDAATSIADASTDSASSADGNGTITDASTAPDVALTNDSGIDSGAPARFVFATTKTTLYSLNVSTYALHAIGTFSTCGIPSGYDSIDPSQDSLGGVFLLTHFDTSGQFNYYAVEKDGGCVNVHGAPGSGQSGPGFWAGYQKVGSTDTLLALEPGQQDILEYDGTGDYLTATGNVLPNGGAGADIACTSALCYTALTASRCSSDSGATDCLFAFPSNGGATSQIGSFGKSGIVGIAYDEGYVFGFASDGSIWKISTTAPSVGTQIATTGTSSSGLGWQGAASTSANL